MGFPSLLLGVSIKGSLQLLPPPSVNQRIQVLMMDNKVPCLLLSLLTNLNLCFGQYGSTITDDVERVPLLKQNFPSDYVIPVSSIPKDVAGTCWMTLNLYPLEESLVRLSNMFGEHTNRESLLIFIIMLQSVRVKLDHMKLEMIMQDFHCHFQEQHLLSGPYFDYVENFLRLADREIFDLSCVAPLCPSTQPTYTTTPTPTQGTSQEPQCLRTPQTPEVREEDNSRTRTPLLFAVILFTTCVAVLVCMARPQRRLQTCSTENIQMQPTNTSQTAPASLKHD